MRPELPALTNPPEEDDMTATYTFDLWSAPT